MSLSAAAPGAHEESLALVAGLFSVAVGTKQEAGS